MSLHLVPMVGVSDVARSIAFYQNVLNLQVVNTYESEGQLIWVYLKADQAELMLALREAAAVERLDRDVILYFYPDNIEMLHARLRYKGYEVSDLGITFYGMQEFRLTDPDGYELCFGQAVDALSN
ncbi:MAG: VOC family protein [Synechococcales cyanobacterium C42_A2020_086]|nr:VOC family protein [Synechococcales cyanobacterium C42_A2020_086]